MVRDLGWRDNGREGTGARMWTVDLHGLCRARSAGRSTAELTAKLWRGIPGTRKLIGWRLGNDVMRTLLIRGAAAPS